MDPRDPNNDRIRRFDPNAPRPPRPQGQRPNRQPPPGPARAPTGALRPLPSQPPLEGLPAQDFGAGIRLDPNSPPGEFNFLVPQEMQAQVPQVGLIAEADGPIPPQLYKAVDEVLGFIYGLDQQFENQGRRPKK
jgi:hypothetical protein